MSTPLLDFWVRDETFVPGTTEEILTEDSIVIQTEDGIDIVTEGN